MGINLKENYPKILLFLYAIIWIVLAIHPNYRSVWIDENILPVLFVFFLIFTYKKFRFSNLSYSLMFIFLILHAIGGHYSYTEVPLFNLIKEQYGLMRNDYDRVVHFMFGVLFFLPFHEVITRIFKVPKGWRSLTITLFIVLSIKELFEITEYSYTALRHNTLTSTNYLGEQGDSLDSIKDVFSGFIGAIISLIINVIKRRFFNK
jgi:putative membrane protein